MVLPALVTEFVLQPRWLFLSDGRASRRVGLISQVAHLYALRDHLTDRDQEWIPTGGARAATTAGHRSHPRSHRRRRVLGLRGGDRAARRPAS